MLADDKLIERIKSDYTRADDLTSEWREEAVGLYDMVAGHQWEEIDKLKMDNELRPAVTFNLAAKYLDAVSGLQITNRQEIKYHPRQVVEDAGSSQLLNGAVKWARDESDAETEESEAFIDCTITGVGCVEHFISTDENPEGDMKYERRDILEMYWDPMARKRNITDARWLLRIRMYEERVFEQEYPGKLEHMGSTSMGLKITNTMGSPDTHIATEAWKYENNAFGIDGQNLIPVFEYQYYEDVKYVSVETPVGKRELKQGQWPKFKQLLDNEAVPYRIKKYKKREYYLARVAGDEVLRKGLSPSQTGFTYKFITGKRDRNKNTWTGIGRALKDPQQWVNKFFSDILHIIQSNAKGGLLAEEDAFADPARAEEEWAKPNSITWMEENAIRDGKIMAKPQAQYPQGMDRLMQFAMNAMPETTGMNLEVMGMANKVQPGIVEQHRKQAAMTILAWAFDSMRRYYHESGRISAEYISKYIADGRLIRIAGKESEEYIPLIRDKLNFQYDIIVDEAPHSTNMKEKVFGYILEMMPYLAKGGMEIPPEFFEYSPLPVEMTKKIIARMKPDPKAQQMQETMHQLEMAEQQGKIQKQDSETQKNVSVAELNKVKAMVEQMEARMAPQTRLSEIRKNNADSVSKLLPRGNSQ